MILITISLTLSYLGRLFSVKELFMLGPLLAWAITMAVGVPRLAVAVRVATVAG